VARHSLARTRRKSSVALAALVAPAAVLFAAAGGVHSLGADSDAKSVDNVVPCCVQLVAAAPSALPWAPSSEPSSASAEPERVMSASRWRVAPVAAIVPRLLPVGRAPEQGLQVRTILASRSISAAFPEIQDMGGVRPDPLPWHPNGLAIDVTIPNPGTAEGIALGNEIVAYVLKNATRFGMQDAIWRGTYYTPGGPSGSGYGHYDHVHITTTGGGYPTGGETYFR
jgi:hypothetical protein